MRILYLAFADLGIPRAWTVHVLAICRHLRALGHEVTLVAPVPSRPVDSCDVDWVQVPVRWARLRALAGYQVALWRGLPGWIHGGRIEAVYLRAVPFAPWLPARIHECGAAAATEVNGILEDELAAEGHSLLRACAYRATERLLLEGSDGVVTVTPAIGERIRSLCPRIRRIVVVRNGVDPGCFDTISRAEARRSLGLPDGPLAGFVGAFYRSRALDRLVASMAHVRRRLPGARLLLVGDGPERPAVAAAMRAADPDAVILLGEVPPAQVPTAIAAMDACVFLCTLPRAETAVKLFEYMAGRRAIVASWTAGVGEWMEREGTGIGVDAASIEGIALGISRLLANREESEAMGARGRVLVEARHTWRRSAEETADFLAELVHRRQHGRS